MHCKPPVAGDHNNTCHYRFSRYALTLSALLLVTLAHATPATPTIEKQVSHQSRPVLYGTADPMASSTLSIAGARYHLTVDLDGLWSLDLAEELPVSGSYQPELSQPVEIQVTSTDVTGNLSHDLTQLELSIRLDSDQDGVADYADSDSDNDGISDAVEGNQDTDADGVKDYLDTDSDNDGIPDAVERALDSDADSLPDFLDPDSDNDGILDTYELGDQDADLIPDRLDADADNDSLPDRVETADDFDGDGVPNYLDLDSDNDGIADRLEAYGTTPLTARAGYRLIGQTYSASATTAVDTDRDGLPDFTDLDSDNDGIPDVRENFGPDNDYNGIVDTQQAGNVPVFGNGQEQALQPARDSDHDQIADFRDLDSDNDGITDLRETYGGPEQQSGTLHVFVDSNQDGLDDLIALRLKVRDNADSDLQANYLDLDSDNNGLTDLMEAGFVDALGDGIVDSLLDSDRDGIPDSVDVSQTGGKDLNADGIDDASNAFFLGTGDEDRDGIADSADPDADGDGKADHLLPAPDLQTGSIPMTRNTVDVTQSKHSESSSTGLWLEPLLLLLLVTGFARFARYQNIAI